MKKWLKYSFISLLLLFLIGGRFYCKTSTPILSSVNHSVKNENKNSFLNLNQNFSLDSIFLEADEEDNIHSENFTDFFFKNDFYNSLNSVFDYHFIKKKTEFNNRKSFHLPSKIYIL